MAHGFGAGSKRNVIVQRNAEFDTISLPRKANGISANGPEININAINGGAKKLSSLRIKA